MWTHLARSETSIDMSIFPRLLALSEVLWTPPERRGWDDFSRRLKLHEVVLASKQVKCFERNPGLGMPNITCGQDGRLWLVNAAGEIYRRRGDKWERFPGQARQVTSARDGTVWSVTRQPTTRGYALMRWSEAAGEWQPLGRDVAAVQISAGSDGSLWASTEAYALWRYREGQWANVLGLAREVSVGSDGTVWILTMDPGPGGFELYAAPPGGRFRRVQPLGTGVHVTAGERRQAWVSRPDGRLGLFAKGEYQEQPGKLAALTASGGGEVWGFTEPSDSRESNVVEWTTQGWKVSGPVP
jgi:hypothetical protein